MRSICHPIDRTPDITLYTNTKIYLINKIKATPVFYVSVESVIILTRFLYE